MDVPKTITAKATQAHVDRALQAMRSDLLLSAHCPVSQAIMDALPGLKAVSTGICDVLIRYDDNSDSYYTPDEACLKTRVWYDTNYLLNPDRKHPLTPFIECEFTLTLQEERCTSTS